MVELEDKNKCTYVTPIHKYIPHPREQNKNAFRKKNRHKQTRINKNALKKTQTYTQTNEKNAFINKKAKQTYTQT